MTARPDPYPLRAAVVIRNKEGDVLVCGLLPQHQKAAGGCYTLFGGPLTSDDTLGELAGILQTQLGLNIDRTRAELKYYCTTFVRNQAGIEWTWLMYRLTWSGPLPSSPAGQPGFPLWVPVWKLQQMLSVDETSPFCSEAAQILRKYPALTATISVQKPTIAPVAIIEDGDEFLIQIKDQQHPRGGCGLWSLFGGKQEEGETSEQALTRELEEELRWTWSVFSPPLTDVEAEGPPGTRWIWRPYRIRVPRLHALSLGPCTEGHPMRISAEALRRALAMEGQPLLKGPDKGAMQQLFFPGIADVLRQHPLLAPVSTP